MRREAMAEIAGEVDERALAHEEKEPRGGFRGKRCENVFIKRPGVCRIHAGERVR